MPSVARRELAEANPNGYVWRLLEYRNYRDTKAAIDRAPSPDKEPQTDLAAIVNENAFRLMQRLYGTDDGEEDDDA